MWGREISGDMYKLWDQSSCSVHSHNIMKQYMHTVAYMALHAQDTLPHLSIGALGDNCYQTHYRDVASYLKVVWSKCTYSM